LIEAGWGFAERRSPEGPVNLLLALIVVLLILSLPAWPYSMGWGYYPSGGAGIVLLVLLIVLLSRRRV
jgi:hypothetical protein